MGISYEPALQKMEYHILNTIRRMTQIGDNRKASTAYYSLFESHQHIYEYNGLIAWGGTSFTHF